MPELWMPGATRLDIGDHAPTDGGPAKAIAHITWDENATAAKPQDLVPYERLVDWFGRNPDGKPSAPHLLWDPFTGRVTQFCPANSRSKSLVDKPGGTRTNRAGKVLLQVEALFFPYCRTPDGKVYAKLADTPCKGWAELNAWIRSWGVPDRWPNGRPENCTRDERTWETEAGWYPHAAVPENDHGDPLSWPNFTTTPEQEDDMDPVDVWAYHGKLDGKTDPRDAYAYLRDTETRARRIEDRLARLEQQLLSDAQIAAIAKAVVSSPALANAIADKLATRLAN